MKSPPNTAGHWRSKAIRNAGGSAGIRPQTVWNNEVSVSSIRNLIISEEVSTNGDKFRFVGEAAFSPDEIRVDLFSSENGGYVKSASLDTALLEKLQNIAEHLREAEGWSWCDGRLDPISHYGKDTKIWRLHAVPPVEYTEAESERLAELEALEAKYEDENPGVNDDVVAGALEAVWEEQQTIAHRAKHRAWTDEMKQSAGVVVSGLARGESTARCGAVRR